MTGSQPYLPGNISRNPSPLSRYLPPLAKNQVAVWLQERYPKGTWLLDPFGSAPALVVEAARAGYQVLVAINNPILRLLLEIEAASPTEADLRASLAELAASYKGDQRIEPHIRGLYETLCSQCRGAVEVECFLWEKGADFPYARIYHCPHCGDSGERPSIPEDLEKAAEFSDSGLHRARALERIAPRGDPDREHAEDALTVYLPRAVYALFTLINKTNALSLTGVKRQRLDALLLHACDRANTLWPHPTQRERPRQLTIPPRFRENNLWTALEQAVTLYGTRSSEKVTVNIWPDTTFPDPDSNQGGILLFQGRLKELEEKDRDFHCEAAYAAIPRPNQAFWTLSALWSGWLWGRESAAPIKTVLRRRRYDWAWHAAALSAVFARLHSILRENAEFFTLIAEAEPGLVSAALAAGSWNGLENEGAALRAEASLCQVHFRLHQKVGEPEIPDKVDEWIGRAASAGIQYLRERGQPSPYLPLHTAAITSLLSQVELQSTGEAKKAPEESPRVIDYFNQLQQAIKEALTFRGGFLRFDGSTQNQEVGQWWLSRPEKGPEDEPVQPPLADRVEIAIVHHLIQNLSTSPTRLDTELSKAFPGLLTPDLSLLNTCLESYALQEPTESSKWRLRAEDKPAARRQDLNRARKAVIHLGEALGFIPEEAALPSSPGIGTKKRSHPIAWRDARGNNQYLFYFTASAILYPIAFEKLLTAKTRVIVFPVERSNLISYKTGKDPFLMEAINSGWRFLNYGQLEQLAENPLTTRKTFEDSLTFAPLSDSGAQMRLL
jgi:hypothetical protein